MTTETKSTAELIDRYMGCGRPETAQFRQLVDMMVAHMLQYKLAPDEVRDAAYVASIKFMQMNPVRRIVYERDDLNLPRSK